MLLSTSQVAAKHGIPVSTLRYAVKAHRAAWGAVKAGEGVLASGYGQWLLDDESAGFKAWLSSYCPGRGQYRRHREFSEEAKIASEKA